MIERSAHKLGHRQAGERRLGAEELVLPLGDVDMQIPGDAPWISKSKKHLGDEDAPEQQKAVPRDGFYALERT